jgi:hypothetical protein
VQRVYLAFPFDNERLWNEGVRTATLAIRLRGGGGAPLVWRLLLAHRRAGPHRVIDRYGRAASCGESVVFVQSR